MLELLIAFGVALVVTLLLIRSAPIHFAHSGDDDFNQPQKFHVVAVPRIGGAGIVAGIVAGVVAMYWSQGHDTSTLATWLLACSIPAFLAGFVQDMTEALTPRGRLLATALSAVLAFFVIDAAIVRTEIPGLETLVQSRIGSLFVTVFAVAGIANSVNIIDGFNGLASMCVVIMLAALAYVGFKVGDDLVLALALSAIGAVLGFFIWNFPAGLIFLGDGGAYFLGFLVAELAILLLYRHPGEVSPLFPLLVCAYPAFETLFSIYRRRVLRAASPSAADGIHLHSLIYRRLIRWTIPAQTAEQLTRQNSMTSPYLWLLCMASVAPAVLFWSNTLVLATLLVLFVASYIALYWRIVRFRSPRWLLLSRIWTWKGASQDNQGT